jgi:hypothetical protein
MRVDPTYQTMSCNDVLVLTVGPVAIAPGFRGTFAQDQFIRPLDTLLIKVYIAIRLIN